MEELSISKTATKTTSALLIIALMLSASVMVPATFAKPEQPSCRPEITWVVNQPHYKEAWVRVDVDGEIQDFLISARVHSGRIRIESINGDKTHTNYLHLLWWLPRPPYPWWVWIGSVPSFHIYLDPATAINVFTALAVLGFLLGVVATLTGPLAIVALLVLGIIGIAYTVMYSWDHNSDNSFDLWVPYDWYNILCVGFYQVYMATRRYWWIGTFAGPWVVGYR